jgi:hypothetical protein
MGEAADQFWNFKSIHQVLGRRLIEREAHGQYDILMKLYQTKKAGRAKEQPILSVRKMPGAREQLGKS